MCRRVACLGSMGRGSFRGLLTGLFGLGALAGPFALAQVGGPAAQQQGQEQEDVPVFEPAEDLSDALQRAMAAVRQAEELSSDRGKAYTDKFLEARHYTQEARKFDPVNAKAEFVYGRLNILIGRSRDAFSQVEAYVQTPEGSVDWEGFKVLGDLNYAGTYYVLADANYRKAAQLAPSESSVFLGLSKCNLKQARRPKAVAYARKASELDPTSIEALEVLSETLLEANDLAEARNAILAAREQTRLQLQEDPGSQTLLSRMQQQIQSQQGILRALLQQDQAVASLYLEYAQCALDGFEINRLILMNQLQASLGMGINATQPKTPPELIRKYAEVSAAADKRQEAVELLEKYLEAVPMDEAARRAVDALKAGIQTEPSVAAAPAP